MKRPTRAVVIKYGLLQIPGIAIAAAAAFLLNRWLGLPPWAAAMIVALWIVKDAAMFFVTWRAYAGSGRNGGDAMVGLSGEALNSLAPDGRVCVRGENWAARLQDETGPVDAGAPVAVVAVEGLTLIVAPVDGGSDPLFWGPGTNGTED